MDELKFPIIAEMLQADEAPLEEMPEEKPADPSPYLGAFELSKDVQKMIEEYGLSDDVIIEGEEAKEAKLKPEIAQDLADTRELFRSRKTADGRFDSMPEEVKQMVQAIGKEVSPNFAFEVEASLQESNDAYSFDVTLKKGSSEDELSILYYSYEPGIQLSEGASSWNWAAWLGLEESPFYDSDMSDDYDYDSASTAMEEMIATFKESQDYWDVKEAIKKLEKNHVPVYTYHINLDERGEFYADVRDENEQTVYTIKSNEDGQIEQVEDGFMRHKDDLAGLERYLKQLEFLPKNAELVEAE